jgi:hypothetical protein
MSEADPMRWMWRGVIAFTLLLGWVFILIHNNFHLAVPTVMMALGYFAVVMTVATLWRVGAAAVEPIDDSPEQWARPIGPRAELDKEKKTLLKAIKEAEFDQAMGKLSKADAEDLIKTYRARAIEIIKQLDALDSGHAAGPRDQIQREVQARLALDDRPKKGKKPDKQDKPADDKPAEPAPQESKEASS